MTVVLCSGGFDPLHVGHLRYIYDAAKKGGRVFVALNSDAWLIRKKGYFFMTWEERAEIMRALSPVAKVLQVHDEDDSVASAIRQFAPAFFANGGDRLAANIHEHRACRFVGTIELFNVGGPKVQSSQELIKAANKMRVEHRVEKVWPAEIAKAIKDDYNQNPV